MTPARRRLDEVLSPDFIEGLEKLPLRQLRYKRQLADQEEVEQSFVRRQLQGKLDLLQAELRVRAGEAHSLIESLPEVLGDERPRPQYGRLPRYFSPGEHPYGRRPGDEFLTDDMLARLDEISDEEIVQFVRGLQDQESRVSTTRRRLHVVIDALQEELTRRYASGEASIDGLLG
jgi:anti-sigma-K factor RsiG